MNGHHFNLPFAFTRLGTRHTFHFQCSAWLACTIPWLSLPLRLLCSIRTGATVIVAGLMRRDGSFGRPRACRYFHYCLRRRMRTKSHFIVNDDFDSWVLMEVAITNVGFLRQVRHPARGCTVAQPGFSATTEARLGSYSGCGSCTGEDLTLVWNSSS